MEYRLDELFNLQMGKTPSRNNPEYWDSEDYKWISIGDLSKCGKYICETKEHLSGKAIAESGISQIPANTVIMSFKLSIGKTAITPEPMYSNEAIMSFRDKKVVPLLPDYIFYMFSGRDWNAGTNKAVMGKTLNKATLSQIKIKVHSLPEQQEIVRVLDKATAIIEARQQELQKLDDLVKARFVEMFGMIDNNPYHFPMATLKEVCYKITDGKHGGCETETDSGYYYVGAREIYDGCIHYDTAPQISYADFAKDYKRCNIEPGDVVIVNTGATIGKTAIATSPLTEHTLLQKSVALLKVKSEIINAEFLRHCYMVNPSMYKVESASAQPNLLLSKMNATRIYLPPLALQEQFAALVAQVDKSKVVVLKALDKAQTLFDSLMQQYFG